MAVGAGAEVGDVEIIITEAEEETPGGRIMIEMFQMMMVMMGWEMKAPGQGGNKESCK